MKNLYDMLFFGIKENLLHLYSNPQNLQIVLGQHKAVLDAIRGHDPDAAVEAMKGHITFVIDFFQKNLS
jgi:GntR family transcriptional repressor for pyruvate dehydrogenase complex